jgi:predicted dehydrogenase
MKPTDRRDFLKSTANVAAAVVAAPAVRTTWGKNSSPNDTIRIAVIGVRGRGQTHYTEWPKIPNVEVATLCDIDEREFPKALKNVEKTQPGKKPKIETDIRKVLEDKSIDAISVAAPDHWHALATIWGCQAGKDVYVEKPTSHNIWEGRKMVEAARKYNRIVQAGMQNRSNKNVQAAMKFLHDGGIGDVYMAKGLCFKPRESIGRKQNGPVPEGVHYDLWLGPAQYRPFNENRFHYTWHWFWDYGCTDLGNQGPHQMDIARWGMNKFDHPTKVHCAGGFFVFDCDQETPNTQLSTLEYPDGKIIQFEVRGLYTNAENGITIGNLFYGSKGWMHLDGSTWRTFFGRKNEPGPSMESKEGAADPMNLLGTGDSPHFKNFIDAMRSRKISDQNADIEEGHRSTALCHLSNIAYRLGRQLQFDPYAECFANDTQAEAYLSRKYRAPYVVPDKV